MDVQFLAAVDPFYISAKCSSRASDKDALSERIGQFSYFRQCPVQKTSNNSILPSIKLLVFRY